MTTKQSGFTLVELAIVLMIIGLLIGGILRGQELMDNARLNATIRQILAYAGAEATFEDAYGIRPGDMPTALQRLPGCTAANNCVNGNGDGTLGTPVTFWTGGQAGIATENTQFWKHLALARLISGVNPSANRTDWGQSHPLGPETGGFTIITATGAGEGSFSPGTLVLRYHGSLTDANVEFVPSLSPKQAGYVDRKMDDGVPLTGNARSKAYGNGATVAACEAAYTPREDKFCIMAFVLNL